MSLVAKIAALLEHVSAADLDQVAPAVRRRLADRCRHVAALAEPKADAPKSGVLADLRHRRRSE